MANTKTTALTAIDAIVAADIFPVVDDVAGTPITKKATATQLRNFVLGATSNADLVATWYGTDVVRDPVKVIPFVGSLHGPVRFTTGLYENPVTGTYDFGLSIGVVA